MIAVYTEDPPERPTLGADLGAASYGTSRSGLEFGGHAGALGFLGHASSFETDGYREHSAARRDQWTSKLPYVGSVVVNAFGGRAYEPRADRNYFVGLHASYRF